MFISSAEITEHFSNISACKMSRKSKKTFSWIFNMLSNRLENKSHMASAAVIGDRKSKLSFLFPICIRLLRT